MGFSTKSPPKPLGGDGGVVPSRAAAVGLGATNLLDTEPAPGPGGKSEVRQS